MTFYKLTTGESVDLDEIQTIKKQPSDDWLIQWTKGPDIPLSAANYPWIMFICSSFMVEVNGDLAFNRLKISSMNDGNVYIDNGEEIELTPTQQEDLDYWLGLIDLQTEIDNFIYYNYSPWFPTI